MSDGWIRKIQILTRVLCAVATAMLLSGIWRSINMWAEQPDTALALLVGCIVVLVLNLGLWSIVGTSDEQ